MSERDDVGGGRGEEEEGPRTKARVATFFFPEK